MERQDIGQCPPLLVSSFMACSRAKQSSTVQNVDGRIDCIAPGSTHANTHTFSSGV